MISAKPRSRLWIAMLLAGLPTAAMAALNVPVASRVLSFVQPAPSGVVTAAILYEPGEPTSEAEAGRIEQELGNGMAIGRATLKARRVPTTALGSLSGVHIAFVTSGIRNQAQIAAAASRNSMLTITSDLGCVRAGNCVVGVSGDVRTQITVSRAAARAANVRFGTAFLMLVKEI